MLTAIVLAAGRSTRMGKNNKMLLPFGNSTIIETVLSEIVNAKVDKVILVVDDLAFLKNNRFEKNDIEVVVNKNSGTGLTSSIQKGVVNALPESDLIICLGDMPLLKSNDYNLLINNLLQIKSQVIIQPKKGNKTGNPIIFSHHFRDEVLGLNESNGCRPIVKSNLKYLERIPVSNEHYFLDIDTEDDYQNMLDSISKT